MRLHLPRLILVAVAGCAIAGCATTPAYEPHPVANPIPRLAPGVYDISQVDSPPVAIQQVKPVYPFELRAKKITGSAKIMFIVKPDGTVADAAIVSATDKVFGDLALAAVVQWRFRPAEKAGVPVTCGMVVPIAFDLK